jgi:hypothetical protein
MHALYEQLRPKYLVTNERLPQLRPKLGLGGNDERLLRLLGEAYTVEEAVERAKIDPDDAARLIAALQALDLVEEWSPGVEQFRARLTSERQYFHEEIARIREESSKREKQLFEGFERALTKISSAVEGAPRSAVRLSDHLDAPTITAPREPDRPAPGRPTSSSSMSTTTVAPPKVPSAAVTRSEVAVAPAPKAAEPILTPILAPIAPSGGQNGRPSIALAPGGLMLVDPSSLGSPSTPADAKYQEAVRQAADNRLDEAEITLREAVRMDASRPDFLMSLAKVLLANPRYERVGTLPVVRSLLDRAIQLSPDNGKLKDFHGEIVREMGA